MVNGLTLSPTFPLLFPRLSLSFTLSFSLSFCLSLSPSPFFLSLSVRTTHVRAIRYDWPDPRFRTNHFIKAVLNKPAFDYTPRHLVVIVPYTSSSLRTLLSARSARAEKNYSHRLSFPPLSRNSLSHGVIIPALVSTVNASPLGYSAISPIRRESRIHGDSSRTRITLHYQVPNTRRESRGCQSLSAIPFLRQRVARDTLSFVQITR